MLIVLMVHNGQVAQCPRATTRGGKGNLVVVGSNVGVTSLSGGALTHRANGGIIHPGQKYGFVMLNNVVDRGKGHFVDVGVEHKLQ